LAALARRASLVLAFLEYELGIQLFTTKGAKADEFHEENFFCARTRAIS
jgi:hypothetical protein